MTNCSGMLIDTPPIATGIQAESAPFGAAQRSDAARTGAGLTVVAVMIPDTTSASAKLTRDAPDWGNDAPVEPPARRRYAPGRVRAIDTLIRKFECSNP